MSVPTTTSGSATQPKHDIHKFRSITHLTDSNWVIHKFEQKAALQERDLWDVTTGVVDEPSDKKSDEWRLWHSKDVSAMAQIIQNLSADIQPLVHDAKTSVDAWQALKDEFESQNLDVRTCSLSPLIVLATAMAIAGLPTNLSHARRCLPIPFRFGPSVLPSVLCSSSSAERPLPARPKCHRPTLPLSHGVIQSPTHESAGGRSFSVSLLPR
jgi:hypothetical protein